MKFSISKKKSSNSNFGNGKESDIYTRLRLTMRPLNVVKDLLADLRVRFGWHCDSLTSGLVDSPASSLMDRSGQAFNLIYFWGVFNYFGGVDGVSPLSNCSKFHNFFRQKSLNRTLSNFEYVQACG